MKRWKNVLGPIAAVTVLVVPVFGSRVIGDGRDQQREREAGAATIQFDIPAQPLSSALLDFGRQAQVNLVLPTRPFEGHISAPVYGELSTDEALAQLLRCLPFRAWTRGDTLIVTYRDSSALDDGPPATPMTCTRQGALVS